MQCAGWWERVGVALSDAPACSARPRRQWSRCWWSRRPTPGRWPVRRASPPGPRRRPARQSAPLPPHRLRRRRCSASGSREHLRHPTGAHRGRRPRRRRRCWPGHRLWPPGPEKIYGRQPAARPPALDLHRGLGLPGDHAARPPGDVELHVRRRVQRDDAEHEQLGAPGDRGSGYINGATACYVDNPDTISVSGGYLNLTALQVAPFTCPDGSNSFTTTLRGGHGVDVRPLRSDLRRLRGQRQAAAVGGRGPAGDDVAVPAEPHLRGLARLGRDRLRRVLQRVPRASMCPTSTTRSPRPIPTSRRSTASSIRTRSTRTASTGPRPPSPSCTTANPAWSTIRARAASRSTSRSSSP